MDALFFGIFFYVVYKSSFIPLSQGGRLIFYRVEGFRTTDSQIDTFVKLWEGITGVVESFDELDLVVVRIDISGAS